MKKIISILLIVGIAFSEFGQNILQYEEFDWKYIQSDYFDIYFYDNGFIHSQLVEEESTKAYKKISNHLNWDLSERYSIILHNSHNDFQQTNVINMYMREGIGGVTELYKNRIVIPFDGSLKEFKHVLHHEMVHMFINDMLYGGSVRNMMYSNVQPIPLWMNEGLAEFLAHKWDANSEMWARDLAINGQGLPAMNQLNGYLAYRGGQSIWKFITEEWGEEIIAELFWKIKKTGRLDRAIKSTMGIDLEGLLEKWHEYLKDKYWVEVNMRDNLSDIGEIIIDHSKLENSYNIAPSISPTGEKFAIYSNKEGNMAIYLVSTNDGKFLRKIINGETTTKFEELHILKPGISWSSDGKKIVFAAKAGERDALYILDLYNDDIRKISFELEGIFQPAWHPLGNSKIAFIGNNGRETDIYVYDYDIDELTNLTQDWFSEQDVSWSKDGNFLYFISNRNNYNFTNSNFDIGNLDEDFDIDCQDIYKINFSTYEIDRITSSTYNESYPIELNSGELIYISDESGIRNIYIQSDSDKKAITNVTTGITQFSLNKNNNQILFSGLENLGYNIYSITEPLRLTNENINIPKTSWIDEDLSYDKIIREDNSKSVEERQYKNFVLKDLDSTKLIIPSATTYKPINSTQIINYDKPRFTLDYGQLALSFDMTYSQGQGMAQILLSDMLGNHRIYINTEMEVDFKNSDYLIEYHYLPKRLDWYFRFYHFAYFYYDNGNGFLNENYLVPDYRSEDLGFLVYGKYPIDRFSRFEFALNLHQTSQTRFDIVNNSGGVYFDEVHTSSLNVIQPYVKYVFDNTRWSGYSPSDGSRLYLKYRFAPNTNSFDYKFQSITADIRNYKSFGITSFAARLFAGKYFGNSPYKFKVGGTPWIISSENRDEIIYSSNGQQYFSEYVFPIRGIPISSLLGDNVMLFNLEYRLPMLLYYFPTIKWLGQLNGVFFTDIGIAWNDDFPDFNSDSSWGELEQGWYWTYGFGPRFIFLGMPWKLNYTWEYKPLTSKNQYNGWFLSVGFDY